MKKFEEKIMDATKNLVNITEDTVNFGFDFSECFPATTYFTYEKDGKPYIMKLVLSIRKA